MADIRIKDLATLESASLTGDVFVIDGTTGTRKLSAFSPSFGGNATVTGTLTVNGASTFNNTLTVSSNVGFIGKSGSGTGGNWRYISDDGTSRWLSGILGSPSETAFDIYDIVNGRSLLTLTAAGVVKVPQTTASTTTSTGALVVGNGTSGGLGVGGSINTGGTLRFHANANLPGVGSIGISATYGLNMYASTGSSYDFTVFNAAGSSLILNPTGTQNLTLPGTLTVNGTGPHAFSGALTINPSSGDIQQNFQRSGTGKGILAVPGTAGNIVADSAVDDFVVRTTSGKAFRVTTDGGSTSSLSVATATVSVLATTASTSTSTGALVVSGGVGVAGAVNGANLRAAAGTGSSVSFGYTSETNTGFHLPYANWNQATVNGISVAAFVAGYNGAVGGMILINNLTTPPNVNPSGGGWLYCEGGALKYRGSSGTVTTIANA